jgi:hypothetical protein
LWLRLHRRRDRHARARLTTACRQQMNRSKSSWLRRSRSRTSVGRKPDFDREFRDKVSNPVLHVQSVVSFPLDDPGMQRVLRPPRTRGRRSGTAATVRRAMARTAAPTDVFYASRLPFDPGSPAAASYVEEHWSPALLRFPGNAQAKAELNSALNYLARKRQRNLSLSGGASIVIRASQAGHHPLVLGWIPV